MKTSFRTLTEKRDDLVVVDGSNSHYHKNHRCERFHSYKEKRPIPKKYAESMRLPECGECYGHE